MKVIVLTWHFPPSAEVAGKVTFRLVRQLAARGHDVTVVAPTLDKIPSRDHQFGERVGPNIRVIRVAPWPDLLAIMANWRQRMRKPTTTPDTTGQAVSNIETDGAHPGGLHGLLRELRGFPDFANRWIIPASRAVRRIIAADGADFLLSVSPYFSTHLAAKRAHTAAPSVGWWAWSHDPASGNSFDLRPDNWRQSHIERWEAAVVRESDGIAVTTAELAENFFERFGRRPIVAGCGFDPAELPAPRDPPSTGPMVLTHAGTLYGHRTPVPLFEAIAELRTQGKVGADDIRLRLIGDWTDLQGERLDAAITRLSLDGIVSLEPPVSQADAVRAIQDSHVGVVLAEGQPLQVPAKTFDYAGLNRPVLALADGATASLITECGLGVVAARPGLAAAVMELLAEFRADRLHAMTARVAVGAASLTVERQFAQLIEGMETAQVGLRQVRASVSA